MLKTCMTFLLEFVYCAFFILYIERNLTNSTNNLVCFTLCILVMEFKDRITIITIIDQKIKKKNQKCF